LSYNHLENLEPCIWNSWTDL